MLAFYKVLNKVFLEIVWPLISIVIVYSIKQLLLRNNIDTGPYALYTVAISANALLGGFNSGLFTLLIVSLGITYNLIPPIHSLNIEKINDSATLLLFILQGFLIAIIIQHLREIGFKLKKANKVLERNQKELEIAKNNYQKVINANMIGVLLIDAHGHILEMNDTALNLIGISRDELKQEAPRWDSLTPQEFWSQDLHSMQEVLATGYAGPYEKELIRKDGQKVPVLISYVLLDEEVQTCLCLLLDITARKMIEAKKDEFIGVASHELKTPLTSIQGYLQLVQTYMKKQNYTKAEDMLEKIDKNTSKLTALINELLDISRIQAGRLVLNPMPLSFNTLVEDTVEELGAILKDFAVITEFEDEFLINADPLRLSQVLKNLISNAAKYSKPNTTITLRLLNKGSKVRFEIEDQGIGIAKNRLGQLFEKFYRVREASPEGVYLGFGLGLYITSEIIKSHHSQIKVESELGKGSKFYFSLPKT